MPAVLKKGGVIGILLDQNVAADIRAHATAMTEAIETAVREYPEKWPWGHDRWRTRPIEER